MTDNFEKPCTKCGVFKSFCDFYKDKKTKDKLTYNCKECNKSYARSWHKSNIQKSKETKAIWSKNNTEKKKNILQEWFKNNPGKRNATTAKRRKAVKRATPPWLSKKLQEIIDSNYVKASILYKQTGIKHHVDHIVPLQGKNVCGLHVPWNLQVIPASENQRKYNNYE